MARRRPAFGITVVVVASSICLATGCTNDRPAPADAPTPRAQRTTTPIPTTTLPDLTRSAGMAASVRQFREDEAVDAIQVELVRGSSDTEASDPSTGLVFVTSVQLDWPGFSTVPPTERAVQVAAGQRVDVPTPLGAVVCDTSDTPAYSLGSVIVTVDVGGCPCLVVKQLWGGFRGWAAGRGWRCGAWRG